MFGSNSTSAVERGIGWLERIIDLIIRLLNALKGGSSSTTEPVEEAEGE